jgi:hypothetical protein
MVLIFFYYLFVVNVINSCTVRPAVNDMKSCGFLDNYSMKAKGKPDDDKRLIIKLFALIMQEIYS